MNHHRWLPLIVSAIVLPFLVQSLADLFSTMFGILDEPIFSRRPTVRLPVSLAPVLLSLPATRLADTASVGRSRPWGSAPRLPRRSGATTSSRAGFRWGRPVSCSLALDYRADVVEMDLGIPSLPGLVRL